MASKLTIKDLINIGLFLLAILGAAGSYFKAIADVRTEVSGVSVAVSDNLRKEMKENYYTKPEAQFLREAIIEIKDDLKEIKRELKGGRAN